MKINILTFLFGLLAGLSAPSLTVIAQEAGGVIDVVKKEVEEKAGIPNNTDREREEKIEKKEEKKDKREEENKKDKSQEESEERDKKTENSGNVEVEASAPIIKTDEKSEEKAEEKVEEKKESAPMRGALRRSTEEFFGGMNRVIATSTAAVGSARPRPEPQSARTSAAIFTRYRPFTPAEISASGAYRGRTLDNVEAMSLLVLSLILASSGSVLLVGKPLKLRKRIYGISS